MSEFQPSPEVNGDSIEPEKKKRSPWPWVAGVGVVAVIGGAGAWAVTTLAGSDHSEVAEVLPENTLAYVGVNTDPSSSQKIKLAKHLDKFKTLTNGDVNGDSFSVKKAVQSLASACNIPEPGWVGDQVTVAAVASGDSAVGLAGYLAVGDTSAAKKWVEENSSIDCNGATVTAEFVSESGGWVVVEASGNGLSDVRTPNDNGFVALTENQEHSDDIEDLGDEGVFSFWLDMNNEVIVNTIDQASATLGSDPDTQKALESIKTIEGVYGTLRASDNGVEFTMTSHTQQTEDSKPGNGDAGGVLGKAPANSVGVFALDMGDADIAQQIRDAVQSDPTLLGGQDLAPFEPFFDLIGKPFAVGMTPAFGPAAENHGDPAGIFVTATASEQELRDMIANADPQARQALDMLKFTDVGDGQTAITFSDDASIDFSAGKLADESAYKNSAREPGPVALFVNFANLQTMLKDLGQSDVDLSFLETAFITSSDARTSGDTFRQDMVFGLNFAN